jgi:hypothetical protein
MTISIIKRTTKYFSKEDKKEPEIKEKVLSEFKTTPENSTAILEMLQGDCAYPIFNKDNDIEYSQYLPNINSMVEEEIIIKFSK